MRTGISLGALAAVQLLAGLAMQLAVISLVGTGPSTDAMIAAQTIPLLITSTLGSSSASIWQPQLATAAGDGQRFRETQQLSQGQGLWLTVPITLLLGATASLWVGRLFPGLDEGATALAISMTVLFLAGAVLNVQTMLLTVGARARGRFILPELLVALSAIAAVVAVFAIVPRHGVIGAAWIGAARAAAACGMIWLISERPWPTLRGAFPRGDAWRRLRPMLAGNTIFKFGPVIDRYLASHAPSGGLTALALTNTGVGALAQVVERAVSAPAAPQLARYAAAGMHAEMRGIVRRCLLRSLAATALTLLVLVLLRPWWEAIFRQLNLDAVLAEQTWWLSVLLLGYLFVAAVGSIPVIAFIALGDSRTPMRISTAAFLAGVVLKAVGFMAAGLPGLAVATSVYYLGTIVLVTAALDRRLLAT